MKEKNWHEIDTDTRTAGAKLSDIVAVGMGSWKFIIIQTVLIIIWMVLNVVAFTYHWDKAPFILLNLIFSIQAAYAAPIIMISQNRKSERDRIQAQEDYGINLKAEQEIEKIQRVLKRIEAKLDGR